MFHLQIAINNKTIQQSTITVNRTHAETFTFLLDMLRFLCFSLSNSFMRITTLLISLTLPCAATAQDKIVETLKAESSSASGKIASDTSKKRWKAGGVYKFNLGQGSNSNWAAGGDDFSLNINTSLNLHAKHKKGHFTWDNSVDLIFGFVKTTSLGSRKNDDRIDFVSKYDYALNSKINVGSLANFRSQFFPGYSYPNSVKTYASNFLAPGYALVSVGVDYKPKKKVSLFLSPVTSRWVIVADDSLSAKGAYGVTPGNSSINQLGAFATANYEVEFVKNLTYKTRLDMFSNYKKDPLNIDVYMTNCLAVKVFRAVTFNWNLDLIYDDDTRVFGKTKTSSSLQMKSVVAAGVQVRI